MVGQDVGDGYVFSRDYQDCIRLNLQHYIWVGMFGYLLHPDIPYSEENLRIADIGTGTGVWLTDLSRKVHPTCQLDGFDISLSQAEPQAWVPSNVNLHQWDINTEPAPELHGKYDIVHIRLFVFVVKQDPRPLLRKLMRLLKPGGWLQWGEPDVESFQLKRTDPTGSVPALEELHARIVSGPGQDIRLQPRWIKTLPELLAEEGLVQCKSEWAKENDRLAFMAHECNILSYETLLGGGLQGKQRENVVKLISEAARESRAGAMYTAERITAIGKKAGG